MVFALCGLGLAAPAVAEDVVAGEKPKDPVSQVASVEGAKRKARAQCGCAGPRFLRSSSTLALGQGDFLAAWLPTDGAVTVGATRRGADGTSVSVDVPLRQNPFVSPSSASRPEGGLRLARVELVDAPPVEPFYLSLREPAAAAPLDAVRVVPASSGGLTTGAVPLVDALWLGPAVARSTAGCGTTQTRRLEVEFAAGSGALAGYWVDYRAASGASFQGLLDERNVRFFGLGYIGPCEHGVPLEPGPGELRVTPVSPALELLGTWRFQWGEDGAGLPQQTPPADVRPPDPDDNPFLAPPRDPLEELLDDDVDHAAVGLMVLLVAGAAGAAQLLYRARRRRRPHPAEVHCPACAAELTLDLRAPETDGMFCPRCGGATVFVRLEADGTPRAEVFRLAAKGPHD